MRVVAGRLRGRRIKSPSTDSTRPTTDKVREAVFNALNSLDVVDGARVVDLFAGTGALGIEALSRGAAHCVFVERDRDAVEVLGDNIATLDLAAHSQVIVADATGLVASHGASLAACDVVFADPPYGFDDWSGLLTGVGARIAVLESDRPIGDVAGWRSIRERRYGRTFVAFLEPDPGTGGTVEAT